MAKRAAPEVNAGSMADIAFLLLIFFLVTTTIETDSGISRRLPPIDDNIEPPIITEKNIFIVLTNKDDQLLVENELMDIKNLRAAAMAFLDNGGGVGDERCEYCQGSGDPTSSDNPDKAIISLQNDRATSYKMYIAVQNELVAAYNDLRDREAQRLYGQDYRAMEKNFADAGWRGNKDRLKEQLDVLKAMYPQKLSEAEPKKTN
ncbi:MAG: biopolymer transporter ExbD [Rickettsiaceae bacterium]|jgi:biopolymer transport protein ExbD|nr:biopolymer transporter ExbD [Rickettsiaceae bacterium]